MQESGADTFTSKAHYENVAGRSLHQIHNAVIVFVLGQALLWITMLQCCRQGTKNTRVRNITHCHQLLKLDHRELVVHCLPTVVILKWPSWGGGGGIVTGSINSRYVLTIQKHGWQKRPFLQDVELLQHSSWFLCHISETTDVSKMSIMAHWHTQRPSLYTPLAVSLKVKRPSEARHSHI
jgi:hypothetical protein